MTVQNLNKLIQYWKQGSTLNLDSAKSIAESSRKYVEALFFLHLSIEKALKALYVHVNKDHAPYSHNLPYLFEKDGLKKNKAKSEFLSQLNEFNIECRYPDAKYKIYRRATQELFQTFFKKSVDFQKWIFAKLK